jgi:hypothetical protein
LPHKNKLTGFDNLVYTTSRIPVAQPTFIGKMLSTRPRQAVLVANVISYCQQDEQIAPFVLG